MSTKKAKPLVREEYLTIKVEEFDLTVETAINSEARKRHPEDDSMSLFRYGASIDLMGTCISPTKRANESYRISINKSPPGRIDFDATLRDVHVKGDDGLPKFRKSRGELLPVYDIPWGLGLLTRKRGPTNWEGWIRVLEPTLTQILIVLNHNRPLYLRIRERRIDRTRCIDGLSLHTSDPTDE